MERLKLSSAVFVTATLLFASACSRELLPAPVVAQSTKDWRVSLESFQDGPNQYGYRSAGVRPPRGSRYLWATVQVSNTGAERREFNFGSCSLDYGKQEKRAWIIGKDSGVLVDAKRNQKISGHRTVRRRLLFVYSEKKWPSRLRCERMEMPIPPEKKKS